MHDIHPQFVEAVPAIIKELKEEGYEFEAYDENNHFPINFGMISAYKKDYVLVG